MSVPPTLGRKLRFSDVVYAVGATPKSLRLWLQRGLVEIDTPKSEGGAWTEYSFRDIAILSLVRSLANFGVEVPTASAIANKIMGDHFFPQMRQFRNPDDVPAGVLAALWTNRRMQIFRVGDGWDMHLATLWKTSLTREEGFQADLPSSVAALRSELDPASVYISIDVEAVLRTAFERATDSVNEGDDDA